MVPAPMAVSACSETYAAAIYDGALVDLESDDSTA